MNTDISKDSEINISQLYYLIKANIKILIFMIILFTFVGLIYIFSVNPVYNAVGKIIIEDKSSSGIPMMFDMDIGSNKNHLQNEIEVLNSRTTSENTVRSLLDSEYKDSLFLFGNRDYSHTPIRQSIRKFLLLDWNLKKIDNIDNELNDTLFNQITRSLRNNLNISNLRKTDVLLVKYSSYDPNEAALIVNKLIEVYQKRDQAWASGEMSHLKDFLSTQLKIKELELDKIENVLKEFQEQEHIYGLDNNSDLLLNQLILVESDFYDTEAKKNILIERKKYFQNQLNNDEKKFAKKIINTLDVQLFSIRKELSILEAEYTSTKSKEGSSHPAVLDLEQKIKSLKNVLDNTSQKFIKQGINVANPIEYRQSIMDSVINFDVYISGYKSKLNELDKLVKKYESNLSKLPEKYLKFTKLQRDKMILDKTYTLMKQKLEETKINEASQLGKIRIVDPAQSNLVPTWPDKKFLLMVFIILGLFIGICVVFVIEFFDSTVKTIEEIESKGLPILAIIPSIGSLDKKKKKKKGYKQAQKIIRRLLTHEDPKSPISEAYRSLRTSLSYDNVNIDNSKVILVSSPGPGEGKTTTVANLAITYANMGKKTLLIDADLRKPVVHKMFKKEDGSKTSNGVVNYLVNDVTNVSDLYFKSDIENLYVMASGAVPPNPSELLSSSKMDEFLRALKKDFDIILFDTPPLIAVTDAFIVAKKVDKFLLVVRASVTLKGALNRSLVNMENTQNQIDGVIFNGVNDSTSYGAGYYYNYYQYYSKEE